MSHGSGSGSGRLYVIEFTAEDGKGGTATGTVTVSVPKSASQPATDSGLRFASGVCTIAELKREAGNR